MALRAILFFAIAITEQQQIRVPSDMASTPLSHRWLSGVEANFTNTKPNRDVAHAQRAPHLFG